MSATSTALIQADQNTEKDAIEVPDFSATKLFKSANK